MERQYSTMDSSLLLNMIFYMIAGKDIHSVILRISHILMKFLKTITTYQDCTLRNIYDLLNAKLEICVPYKRFEYLEHSVGIEGLMHRCTWRSRSDMDCRKYRVFSAKSGKRERALSPVFQVKKEILCSNKLTEPL